MERVKMSMDGFDFGKVDGVCHFVGAFCRKAFEQGWSEEEVWRACRGITAATAFEALKPHIEPAPRDPLSFRTQYDRLKDYTEGCALLLDDPAVRYRPFRWHAKGLFAIREEVAAQRRAERDRERREEASQERPGHEHRRGRRM